VCSLGCRIVIDLGYSYFNLSGLPTIEGTEVTLSTTLHQEVDDASIPNGQLKPYPGIEPNKPFTLGTQQPEFNHSFIVNGAANGAMIDHCFIVNNDPSSVPIDTRSLPIKKLASFYHPTTGVHLEAYSTEPAFQFYTGEYNNVPAVGDQPARGPRSGFCVEASRYVNAINHEEWRNMVILKRGQMYGSRTVYRAWRDQ
jgi:aldose 1-epimerase